MLCQGRRRLQFTYGLTAHTPQGSAPPGVNHRHGGRNGIRDFHV